MSPKVKDYTDTHRVSKNVPHLACYNVDAGERILIFFGRNVRCLRERKKNCHL